MKRSPLKRRTEIRRIGWLRRDKPLRRLPSRRARPDEPLATWCEAAIDRVCTGRAVHRHHLLRRSQGGSDDRSNTKDVCGACHIHIHTHVEWAYQVGLLRRGGTTTRRRNVKAVAGIAGMLVGVVVYSVALTVPAVVTGLVLLVGNALWVAKEAQPERPERQVPDPVSPRVPCCCLPPATDPVCPVHSPNRHIGADR